MKIRQIHFRNINSFYGEHPPIVFTDGVLAKTGLFVIAGPTGAGKSTLLDVITLALFNRVPRISDGDGRGLSKEKILAEGLIINQQAANEPKTAVYAEVEYELRGQAYRSRWSMEKNRNGNWNDYDMEVAKLPGGELLSNKKRDVPGLNTQQIGLTYEQFVRSMVLAQGAFDKFLKASAGDRSKLLEQITGTDIYRRLSQRAHQKSRAFDDQVKDKRREVSLIRLLPDERVTALTTERAQIEIRLTCVESDILFYRNEAKLVDDALQADKVRGELDRNWANLATRQADFDPKTQQLTRHEQVADLAPTLSDLANAEVNRKRGSDNEQTAKTALAGSQTEFSDLMRETQLLTNGPLLTQQTFDAELNAFRDTVLNLTSQIEEEQRRCGQPLQRIERTIDTSTHDWFQKLNAADIDQTAQRVAARRQEIGMQLVQLEDEYPLMTPERLRSEIDRYFAQEKQLSALIQQQQQQQQRLLEEMELKKKVDEKRDFVQLHKTVLIQLANELTRFEEQKKDLEQHRIRLAQEANLDELRKELTAAEPCPLCGSLEHPYAQHYVRQVGTFEVQLQLINEDLNAKKKEYDALNNQLITAEADEISLNRQRTKLMQTHAASKETIAQELTLLALEPTLQVKSLQDKQQLAEVQRGELVLLQSLLEQETILNRLADDLRTVQESRTRIGQLKQQKDNLFAGDNVKERCQQLMARFNRLNTDLSAQTGLLRQATSAFAGADKQVRALQAHLQPILHERGLADATSARAFLLDAATLRQLQEARQTLADEALELSLRREQEETKHKTATNARQTDLPAETVRQQVRDLEKEQRQKIEQFGNVKAQLLANERDQKRQAKLTKELTKLENEAMPWHELDRLIGSAKGDEYSRFAQGLTLSQLIGLTNRRLRDLSDRYLLLKPRDGQDELYVLDQYQGGAERTVTSLSGGETFTLSLGLALALSDLASQNVQIDSLFVDEGFGTLDSETLDTAIAMLEKLQQESQKTIGIISHRHEVKERISIQIQVEKGNDGNSRVAIVEV